MFKMPSQTLNKPTMTTDAALLFGLNYTAAPEMRLNGCWNDAIGLNSLLTSPNGYNFDPHCIDLAIDNSVAGIIRTRKSGMLKALYELALKSWKESLTRVVISYSGHGSQQKDLNGDELDGLDEGICPSDVRTVGMIIDDELLDIIMQFNPKTTVYAVFDSCHSGSVLDLPFVYNGIECVRQGRPMKNPESPTIIMISGCMDTQTSMDAYNKEKKQFGGALTTALLNTLSQKRDIGLFDMHASVCSRLKNDGFTQIPLLSSSKVMTNDMRFFA